MFELPDDVMRLIATVLSLAIAALVIIATLIHGPTMAASLFGLGAAAFAGSRLTLGHSLIARSTPARTPAPAPDSED